MQIPESVKEFAAESTSEKLRELLADISSCDDHREEIKALATMIPANESEDFYLGVMLGLRISATLIAGLPASQLESLLGAFVGAVAIRYQEASQWQLNNEG